MRLGLVQLRLRRLQRGFAPFEFGPADEVLLAQRRVALEVGRGEVAIGGRGRKLGARRVGRQLVVARIELGEHLARLDALAEFGLAPDDLAGHAEAQARFDAWAHLAGEFVIGAEAVHTDGEDLDGAHRLLRLLRLRAGGQRHGSGDGQAQGKARKAVGRHIRHGKPELKVRV